MRREAENKAPCGVCHRLTLAHTCCPGCSMCVQSCPVGSRSWPAPLPWTLFLSLLTSYDTTITGQGAEQRIRLGDKPPSHLGPHALPRLCRKLQCLHLELILVRAGQHHQVRHLRCLSSTQQNTAFQGVPNKSQDALAYRVSTVLGCSKHHNARHLQCASIVHSRQHRRLDKSQQRRAEHNTTQQLG